MFWTSESFREKKKSTSAIFLIRRFRFHCIGFCENTLYVDVHKIVIVFWNLLQKKKKKIEIYKMVRYIAASGFTIFITRLHTYVHTKYRKQQLFSFFPPNDLTKLTTKLIINIILRVYKFV